MPERETPLATPPRENGAHGVFTLTDVAVNTIDAIETAKTKYQLHISDFTDMVEAANLLLDILDAADTLIVKYFKSNDFKILDEHDFSYFRNNLDRLLQSNPNRITKIYLREVAKNCFIIVDYYMFKLRAAVPIQHSNPRHKIIDTLYAPVVKVD
jgi:hypothetical protein